MDPNDDNDEDESGMSDAKSSCRILQSTSISGGGDAGESLLSVEDEDILRVVTSFLMVAGKVIKDVR